MKQKGSIGKWSRALLSVIGLAAFMTNARAAAAAITAVWANSGDEKVTQDELLSASAPERTLSRVWDGKTISVFGARNEVIAFDLILEAGGGASDVAVSFNKLTGPAERSIESAPTSRNGVFDWTHRNIELFYVRYVAIRGLSRIVNDPSYDERLIPQRLRRPFTVNWRGIAVGKGAWTDRADHDKNYPEIAVPMELVPKFKIAPGRNQSVWTDIYIPKDAPAGIYRGIVSVSADGSVIRKVPVQLTVRKFTLPDSPSAKTMLCFSSSDIDKRVLGEDYINPGTAEGAEASLVRDRYFMLAHRHKVSLIGDSGGDCDAPGDRPCPEWIPRLDGSLFTAAHGYAGPGVKTGNNVYSIGTYGAWSWKDGTREDMWEHTDRWVDWFKKHSPATDYFLYLIDESNDTGRIDEWTQWIAANPGPGKRMESFATIPLPKAAAATPDLDIPTSSLSLGDPAKWGPLADAYTNPKNQRKRFYMYNGSRPGSGSFMTEDDGVALRELAWGQYKKRIGRWFYWNATYYHDFQNGGGDTNLFSQAQTFGGPSHLDADYGQTAGDYGNGDGVLLYPGTDAVFPTNSYGVEGPIASLRLKAWRRGIQDADYLAMAAARNPAAVDEIVNQMVPKVLWEVGVHNPKDPTYQYTDVSWPTNGDAWENARARLAAIIEGAAP